MVGVFALGVLLPLGPRLGTQREFFDVLRIPEDLEIGGQQDTLSIKNQKEEVAEFTKIEKAVLKEIIEERKI